MSAHYPSIVSHDEFIRRFQTAGDKLNALEESQKYSQYDDEQRHQYDESKGLPPKPLPSVDSKQSLQSQAVQSTPAVARYSIDSSATAQQQHPYAYSSARAPSSQGSRHSRGNSLTSRAISVSPIPENGAARPFHYPTRAQSQQQRHHPVSNAHSFSGPTDMALPAPPMQSQHARFDSDFDRHSEPAMSEKGSHYRFTLGDSDAYNRGAPTPSGWIQDGDKKGRKKWILGIGIAVVIVALAVGLGVGLSMSNKHKDTSLSASTKGASSSSSLSVSAYRSTTATRTTPTDTTGLLTAPATTAAATGSGGPTTAAAAVATGALPVGASAGTTYGYQINGFSTVASMTFTVPASVETRANGQWQWTQPVVLPTDNQGGTMTSQLRVRVWPSQVPGYNAAPAAAATTTAASNKMRRLRKRRLTTE